MCTIEKSRSTCNFYNPHHNSFTHVLSKYKWSTWGFCRGSDKRKTNYVTRITILRTQTYYYHVNIFLGTKLLYRIPAPQNNIVWLWKTLIITSHRMLAWIAVFFVKQTNKMEIADIWPLNISQPFIPTFTHICLQQRCI